ncbi:FAD-dependent oxidoreductase [Roseovarius sp. TE539]|uniref:NAD(P)/FAD-dependent oxidoreductase n=1 Tax=Roseovarius sp. TE539 TaxID=2249812 RepID=UPI000DDD645A|nr:FAD-dependent oxidoreductase [Roseovarius sp. TE539]RBI77545.1 FAD-dependent oxidoreductase [Roseovarius sp. TE539]
MRRIYPAHAYGDAPRADCYWPSTTETPEFPAATGKLACDVAVIGAGFTGLSAALHLAEAGADVAVFEANFPGWGASGRNGGFCCCGGAKATNAMMKAMFGDDARREYRRTEVEAVDLVRGLLDRHGIEADTHSEGETVMAHTQAAFDGLEAEARITEDDYGVTPTILTRAELAPNGFGSGFFGAMTSPVGFALNPCKYVLGLARAAQEAGARVFGQSPVARIDGKGGFTLATPAATVTAKRLIVATNGYSSEDLPGWMRGRYLPTQSNVIVTRELTAEEIAAQGWSTHQACFDDQVLLHYFRLMPNRRMLFGMRGGLRSSPASDQRMHRTIRIHFERMFPAWAHAGTPFSWNGLLSIAADLTPYAGPIPEMPGAYTAVSYHGNGVAMGSFAGALLADLALDRTPCRTWPAVMRSPPGRFPLGRLRRANLWPLYAWAMLTGK